MNLDNFFYRFTHFKVTYFLYLCKSIVRAVRSMANRAWLSLSCAVRRVGWWQVVICLLGVHSTSVPIHSLLLPFLSIPVRLHVPLPMSLASPRLHPAPPVMPPRSLHSQLLMAASACSVAAPAGGNSGLLLAAAGEKWPRLQSRPRRRRQRPELGGVLRWVYHLGLNSIGHGYLPHQLLPLSCSLVPLS